MKTENRYFFYLLTYQPLNVILKFRPPKKHAKNWSFWRVEKWEKKKVLGWKNRMKKYFLLKLFLNCFGHWKVSFLTFFDFFRLFVSVLGSKVEKMLVFCSKINEISNWSIHVGISRNRKNLNFCFFESDCSFWACEQPQTIRKMFCSREIVENQFLLQPFVGFLCQNHPNWCIFDDFPDLVIISKLVHGHARVHKNRKNPKPVKMG